MAAIDDLREWFELDLRAASWERNVTVDDSDPANIDVRFYTDVNEYRLTITEDSDGAFIEAAATSRKARAGQSEARSRHIPLSVGRTPLNQRAWRRLLNAVVANELVRVQRQDVLEKADEPELHRPVRAGAGPRVGARS
jgi:hypothetical protein